MKWNELDWTELNYTALDWTGDSSDDNEMDRKKNKSLTNLGLHHFSVVAMKMFGRRKNEVDFGGKWRGSFGSALRSS